MSYVDNLIKSTKNQNMISESSSIKGKIYYYNLASYSSILKRFKGNMNCLLIPIFPDQAFNFLYLGQAKEDKKLLLWKPIQILPPNNVQPMINDAQKNLNGFELLDSLNCIVKIEGPDFKILIPKKGKHIKSNLKLTHEPSYGDNMFGIKGNIDIMLGDTKYGGELTKAQLSFIKGKFSLKK